MLFKESFASRKERIDGAMVHSVPDDNISDHDAHALKNYKLTSRALNDDLINGNPIRHQVDRDTHAAILRHAKPIGVGAHLYSGTRHDFGAMGRAAKDGIIHSPAHISTSHSFGRAILFSGSGAESHFLHIKTKPSDKVLTFDSRWPTAYEKESVIPAGTKLKYSHSTKHNVPSDIRDRKQDIGTSRKDITIHHFTIHSQE